jgi:ATP-dependent HslUV protease, peptidase subunit HslV
LLGHADIIGYSARKIVEDAMKIAANICVYTNDSITIEEI